MSGFFSSFAMLVCDLDLLTWVNFDISPTQKEVSCGRSSSRNSGSSSCPGRRNIFVLVVVFGLEFVCCWLPFGVGHYYVRLGLPFFDKNTVFRPIRVQTIEVEPGIKTAKDAKGFDSKDYLIGKRTSHVKRIRLPLLWKPPGYRRLSLHNAWVVTPNPWKFPDIYNIYS